ncbi:uncharacterized protein [Parasteatoda tepidariorum]|uniref:uncharacterized protein n=1 Tax=Parasteatoda tepidariorum TaxID=114398 RepID=UPI0039BC8BDE
MSVTRPRPVIPEDLPKLLRDISYAVTKNKPNDIISFLADHLQELCNERERKEKEPKSDRKVVIDRSALSVSKREEDYIDEE